MEIDPRGTIQSWAMTLNLSQSHLQHLFKQATGKALGRVLTEKRLQKAALLLANTNLSIKEIASAVGYEHTSSFTRAFERRYEHAPRHYRMRETAGISDQQPVLPSLRSVRVTAQGLREQWI